MVSRSESGSAAAGEALVTRDELQALTASLNTTMEELKATFTEINHKFIAVEQEVAHTQTVTAAKMASFEEVINEVANQTKNHIDRIEHLSGKTMGLEVTTEGSLHARGVTVGQGAT